MKIPPSLDLSRILFVTCLVGSISWTSCSLAAATTLPEGPVATLGAPVASPTIVPAIPVVTLQLQPKDGLLSKALANFATKHGWTVSWELERDFPIDFPARFEGTFLKVIEQVAMTLQSSETPIRVKAYHGNNVLRVMAATQ